MRTLFLLAWLYAAVCLGLLVWAYHAGRRKREQPFSKEPEIWPNIEMIVPLTGLDRFTRICLESLADQDYPNLHMSLVVRDAFEPALSTAVALSESRKHVSVLLAGPAKTCCQKNTNLLTGVGAVGDEASILVFVDSGHLAPAGWLKDLVRPLTAGAEVCSGYHEIAVEGRGVVEWGWAFVVNLLGSVRGLAACRMPWGGATAMGRKAYERYEIEKLWAQSIVDDVTLGALLQRQRVLPALPQGPPLKTPLNSASWRDFVRWLYRQIAFLKYVHPVQWALLSAVGAALVFSIGVIVVVALTGATGDRVLGLFGLVLVSGSLYLLGPPDIPIAGRVIGGLLALAGAALCHAQTWFRGYIDWAGYRYRSDFSGRLLSIVDLGANR